MSAINVFFVASVPNSHRDGDIYRLNENILSSTVCIFSEKSPFPSKPTNQRILTYWKGSFSVF